LNARDFKDKVSFAAWKAARGNIFHPFDFSEVIQPTLPWKEYSPEVNELFRSIHYATGLRMARFLVDAGCRRLARKPKVPHE
jgi:hypothetical protein